MSNKAMIGVSVTEYHRMLMKQLEQMQYHFQDTKPLKNDRIYRHMIDHAVLEIGIMSQKIADVGKMKNRGQQIFIPLDYALKYGD